MLFVFGFRLLRYALSWWLGLTLGFDGWECSDCKVLQGSPCGSNSLPFRPELPKYIFTVYLEWYVTCETTEHRLAPIRSDQSRWRMRH